MRPQNLYTKIFLDGGEANETKEVINLLGFLDGQTTNPTLISKNSEVKKRIEQGEKFSTEEIIEFYKKVVKDISALMPKSSVSVEVYADKNTKSEQMLSQAREMYSWIPNAHIKFPTTKEGLKSAAQAIKENMRVNMTLCFSQEQAAAVYSATMGAQKGQVFVSPFIGRLDDRGENGMDLIENILEMYKTGDGHVEVLTASVRNMDHFLYALKLKSDIITAPFKVLQEWKENGLLIPEDNFTYYAENLKKIPYQEINLTQDWEKFNILHELTDKGISKFSEDWNKLIKL